MAISIDLECIGKKWEDLPESTRLMAQKGWSKKNRTDFMSEEEAKEYTALSPYSGVIVSMSLWDTKTQKGVTFYVNDHPLEGLAEKDPDAQHLYRVCKDEAELLFRVWRKLDKQASLQILSYNGATFDLPYALIRSIANRVEAPWWLINQKRYDDVHIDVRDIMSVYGKSTFPCSLDMVCHIAGVPSPKEGGVSGSDVGRLWAEGDEGKKQVVVYNSKDTQQLGAVAEVLADLGIIRLRGHADAPASDG